MVSQILNPKDVIFALDIGTRSVIGTVGIIKDKKFNVLAEKMVEHEERAMIDGQIHDISLVANAVIKIKNQLEKDLNLELSNVAIAAAGRFLRTVTTRAELSVEENREIDKDMIRSLELTAVKNAEDEVNKSSSGKLYCVGYSVKSFYLNGFVISNLLAHKGENIAAEVIVTFLPRSVVDSLYSVVDKVGLNVVSLTLEPIAAIEAAIPQSLRLLNIALVDVGAGTSDIAISSKDSIIAYGMVPQAGDEITEIISQHFLVDFNTAEVIKKECTIKEKFFYKDILGLENEIYSEEVIKLISPRVKKIAEEIGGKIIELNGDKSPNAVFLVGGGAHTPKLKEFLGEKINLPIQRIGIRGRAEVTECANQDNSLGSIGVTVLGIALVSIKRLGQDFIDVMLNDNMISLFNSHTHTVLDVMLQGGIDPKVLIGKNGKNIKFNLNGIKRVAFGSLAVNAEIKVNGTNCTIDNEIKEGDRIEINFAEDGSDAGPCIKDYIQKLYSVSFYINDMVESFQPIAYVDHIEMELNSLIKQGDTVEIVYPMSMKDYIKYYAKNERYDYFINGNKIEEDYTIGDGDRIYKVNKEIDEAAVTVIDEKEILEEEKQQIIEEKKEEIKPEVKEETKISLIANDKKIILSGKKEYVFIDIFNYIDFDLTLPKGNLVLTLNDERADYHKQLKNGDVIKIHWN